MYSQLSDVVVDEDGNALPVQPEFSPRQTGVARFSSQSPLSYSPPQLSFPRRENLLLIRKMTKESIQQSTDQPSLNRRAYVRMTAAISAGSMTTIAGCSGSENMGPSSEVVENTFSTIELQSSRLENTIVRGSEAVSAIVTVENVGEEPVEIGLDATFYDDSDTIVIDGDQSADTTVDAGVSKEVTGEYAGRKGDVAYCEIRLVEPFTQFS